MIRSVLIANRGEIARRIVRTARRLGVRTVAVYSDADAGAPHVREADAAVRIGPPPAAESYLCAEALLEAAESQDAEAIHPGYGFLSENAAFAASVIAAGRVWIGPPPAAIEAMGRKDAAKRLMAEAGVPVTPGYLGDDQDGARLAEEAAAIGWPVLIKAVAGGGGKGMRKVAAAADFAAALEGAKREAAAAFGDDRVLLERYVERPRHIEVQVFADRHGGVVHLFERDCSLQRRHQKVIEEAPAPGIDAAVRAHLCEAAVRAAKAVAYEGAGTVEFIADGSRGLRSESLWFMEMNTRLQVEHPVTEAVTGVDLVEWQLRVASGEPLPLRQDQIALSGHAIEARLYAEDPARGFLPSVGSLTRFRLPATVRIDAGTEEGGEVSAFYDPMIAKIIAHGADRMTAASTLAAACRAVEVWPVRVNAAFLAACLSDPDFRAGDIDTGFIETRLEGLVAAPPPVLTPPILAALEPAAPQTGPWSPALGATGFRLNAPGLGTIGATVDGEPAQVVFAAEGPAAFLSTADGVVVFQGGAARLVTHGGARQGRGEAAAVDGAIRAPMPGKIVSLAAAVGQQVVAGEVVAVLEAMKMEHALAAPFDGVISEVLAAEGDQVAETEVIVRLESRGSAGA